MNAQLAARPDYGNWVSRRFIVVPGALAVIFLGLSSAFPLLLIVAVPFLLIAAYFLYARYLFSSGGGAVQEGLWQLVLSHLDWNGKGRLLDIGCGNAALTVMAACKYPQATITGIDQWGASWEYSKSVCEKNAALEGVSGRVTFQQASAAGLPFEDGHFDAVISNLTFHEVRDAKDKREVVHEALRVLKKGGKFAFQDLFLMKQMYGEPDDLVALIRSWRIRSVVFVNTSHAEFIPAALKLPFMVGTTALIYGEK